VARCDIYILLTIVVNKSQVGTISWA